jgi:NhaP-type Na+/H+ or K+/H+ antiporter
MGWVYTKTAIAYLHAKIQKKTGHPSHYIKVLKENTVVGWSGMRGIVSLTAALALPLAPGGMPLEGREQVIFMTFVVILLTLLIPGFTLARLLHWLKLECLRDHHQEHKARKEMEKVAKHKINEFRESLLVSEEGYDFLFTYFNLQRRVLEISTSSLKKLQELENLRLEVIREQRKRLLEIWKNHSITDSQLRQLEHELDIEETRFTRVELK